MSDGYTYKKITLDNGKVQFLMDDEYRFRIWDDEEKEWIILMSYKQSELYYPSACAKAILDKLEDPSPRELEVLEKLAEKYF